MEYDAKNFVEKSLKEIKEVVGEGKALVATSGGVDSTVCAVISQRALGEKAKILFIDDGLMREGEPQRVKREFESWGIGIEVVEKSERFFDALKGKEDPEEKRKAFRDTFYNVLGELVKEKEVDFLIQGTIAADILETEKGIKTQHNILSQIGLDPQTYGLKIIEPLREIFKDDVRKVAKELGLPEEVCQRMPFPGPGLATRVIGEVTPERIEKVRCANKIVEEEILKKFSPFQTFAVLFKDRATGLKEGRREFGEIVAVRSVESENALTATSSKIPYEILERITERITKEIPGVIKVLYDLTPKPPSTIEYI